MPTHINVHIIRALQVEDGYAFHTRGGCAALYLQAACVARMKGKHSGGCMSKNMQRPFCVFKQKPGGMALSSLPGFLLPFCGGVVPRRSAGGVFFALPCGGVSPGHAATPCALPCACLGNASRGIPGRVRL